jgi:alkaline phosphatase D
VVAGDLGGHGYCREETAGYAFFDRMRELHPDFFIANGDLIYADSTCPGDRPGGGRNLPGDFPSIDDPSVDWDAAGSAGSPRPLEANRADRVPDFLLEVPMYSQWDDHEVINDFGACGPARAGGRPRATRLWSARDERALRFSSPVPHRGAERIFRSFRWGANVESSFDARSYRA